MFKRLVTAKNNVAALLSARFQSNDPRFAGGVEGPKEHSCGIPPWKIFHENPVPPPRQEFPAHLIRPPCLPGSTPGGYQTCIKGNEGYYCVPCRMKYKYPPFSDNIDFIPPARLDPPCWWKMHPSCFGRNDEEEKVVDTLTKRWECNYDDFGHTQSYLL